MGVLAPKDKQLGRSEKDHAAHKPAAESAVWKGSEVHWGQRLFVLQLCGPRGQDVLAALGAPLPPPGFPLRKPGTPAGSPGKSPS